MQHYQKLCRGKTNEIDFEITLTFAQTLNGSISGAISCKESFQVTHFLRQTHDCILVGINTLKHDNPSLTTRFDLVDECSHPTPVILDSSLKIPMESKIILTERNPVIFCSEDAATSPKATELRKTGAKVEGVSTRKGLLCWEDIISYLKKLGFKSLMIEGGASVITSCLSDAFVMTNISRLVVTVSPKISTGQSYVVEPLEIDLFETVEYSKEGRDMILCLHRLN